MNMTEMRHSQRDRLDLSSKGMKKRQTHLQIHGHTENLGLGGLSTLEAQQVYHTQFSKDVGLFHTTDGGRVYGAQLNEEAGLTNLGRNSFCRRAGSYSIQGNCKHPEGKSYGGHFTANTVNICVQTLSQASPSLWGLTWGGGEE